MRFIIDNANDVIQNDLLRGDFYAKEELETMKSFCPPDAYILEIGANVGNHTIYFSKFFNAKLIYAIEPIPATYKMLLANLCLNYCHNVNVDYIGYALGHTDTIGFPVQIYPDNIGSTRLVETETEANRISNLLNFKQELSQPVQITRGDKFFADKQIDFIKIDAETMEMVILDGLTKTISNNRPNMFIEVSIENTEDFHNWLERNAYKIKWERLYPELHCNFIVVPKER